MKTLEAYLEQTRNLTDTTLEELLPAGDHCASIHGAMRYSLFAGGKRVRPALVATAHEAAGGQPDDPRLALTCAAVEMIHTFSLIHDDLPCMDDDDRRRGRPTLHKAFSEAVAVLAGDALCIFAFEVLARTHRLDIVAEFAQTMGPRAMIEGQLLDVASEGKAVDRATVERIHQHKTAALIRTCVRVGALLAAAPADHLERLSAYGSHVGLAFQIVDDILDEEGSAERLGKDVGRDRQRGKATFPSVVGLEESKRYAAQLVERACDEVAFLGPRARILIELARFIASRAS